jgi:hypothetical protein
MFCKNARTMIALASDTKAPTQSPASVKEILGMPKPSPVLQQQPQLQHPSVKSTDAATDLFLRGRQLDSAMQLLLSRQLRLGSEQKQPPSLPLPSNARPQLDAQAFFRLHQQQQPRQPQAPLSLRQSSVLQARNQILAYGNGSRLVPSSMAISEAINATAATPSFAQSNQNIEGNLNLWQQIQARKQQEAEMVQLRQLMALSLQRQQDRNKSSAKNFRASAA